MIGMNYEEVRGDIGALVRRFDALPKHISRKHLGAAMKLAVRQSRGVQVLKSMTPKKKGKYKAEWVGDKRTAGGLRRSATVKTVGVRSGGSAFSVLGYKYGWESRKAIWQEFGTKRGCKPQRMAERAFRQIAKPVAAILGAKLVNALYAAARELERGMNPTRVYSADGTWRPG
jgi:hypothetical protein